MHDTWVKIYRENGRFSTAQHSTAQHSTAQHSTTQLNNLYVNLKGEGQRKEQKIKGDIV